ncbi:MAG: SDR family oxidoreductase [Salinisphaera sp.]|jgi:NAD(P)-dependent dehydrogenase (short-subunit alcohol dehydrogenase family)|nr:SDR family oxidoreductase [Salinisphaera sp.]
MSQDLFDLAGRSALVTGASSGIGRELAMALAGAGAHVVLAARRRDRLEEAAECIRQSGARASVLAIDLNDVHALRSVAARCADLHAAPDILVNAAGINPRLPVDEIDLNTWQQTLHIHLTVPFVLAQALVGGMQRRSWGRIINIASLQSVRAFPNGMPYGTAKGGVVQMTRAMAEAWSPHGINCNAIAPGFFPTELTAPVFDDTAQSQRNAEQTMIGRNGRLEDLHGIAIFLAASASDYITGQTMFVDGGFTAR